MQRYLFVGDNYALSNRKLKYVKLRCFSLLAVLSLMCLYAAKQASAQQAEPAAPAVVDTTKAVRDTIAIEEVEINAGYYSVTDRERTGSIGRVDAKTIARQPVSNPLAALHGQVAGVEVTQTSGVPGANITIKIRGENSLINGSDPLFIIDGVPFMMGQSPLNQVGNATNNTSFSHVTSGISPLNMLNPSDIVSIEVLKDADATAIYGSRGANGVVLITTRKAMAEGMAINVQYRSGLSRPTQLTELLSGSEYLMMRREGYNNDGIEITADIAPDLLVWDTTAPISFKDLLLPKSAKYNDANISFLGGNRLTQYMISGNYHDEATVYDSRTGNRRFGVNASGSLRNPSDNFNITGTFNFSKSNYDLPTQDVTRYIRYFPFFRLYNEDGSLAWDINGTPYQNLSFFTDGNPLAYQHRQYDADIFNLVGQLSSSFKLTQGLNFKANIGTTLTFNDEWSSSPSKSIDIYSGLLPSATFSNSKMSGWTVEPQLDYSRANKWWDFSALLGATWQHQQWDSRIIMGRDYSSDILLGSVRGAGSSINQDNFREYRYQGFYTRLNGKFLDRYIINLSGRRDGSSRFSPENRYTTFAAIGVAWLLNEEPFMQWANWLDYAKIRASYGITGNDQIGDYKYIDGWSVGFQSYEGIPVMNPLSPYNPAYVWERNKKAEIGFESRFLKERVQIQVAFYRNVSDNQLVQYNLPIQTGFFSVLKNHQAVILNSGWEFLASYQSNNSASVKWYSSINFTLPKNKLLEFPDLETSSYRNRYIVGEATSTKRGYRYLGVNPQTGLYDFEDVDNNGIFNSADAIFPIRRDIRLFGGWTNIITFKQWSLSTSWDFKLQDGFNYLYNLRAPGYGYDNQPKDILKRWRKPGDQTTVQRFTGTQGDASQRMQYLSNSEGVICNASYLRIRNLALSYNLPFRLINPLHLTSCRLSLQGQNLFTLTNYVGSDPENYDMNALPPMRSVVLSVELNF